MRQFFNIIKLYLSAIFEIVGTYLHETAHFLVALLTFSKITSFSYFPSYSFKTRNFTYGSVGYIPRFKAAKIFIGLAPLLVWLLPYYYLPDGIILLNESFFGSNWWWFFDASNWWWFVVLLIAYQGGIPSRVDIQNVLDGMFSVSGIICFIFIYFCISNMQIIEQVIPKILNIFK